MGSVVYYPETRSGVDYITHDDDSRTLDVHMRTNIRICGKDNIWYTKRLRYQIKQEMPKEEIGNYELIVTDLLLKCQGRLMEMAYMQFHFQEEVSTDHLGDINEFGENLVKLDPLQIDERERLKNNIYKP